MKIISMMVICLGMSSADALIITAPTWDGGSVTLYQKTVTSDTSTSFSSIDKGIFKNCGGGSLTLTFIPSPADKNLTISLNARYMGCPAQPNGPDETCFKPQSFSLNHPAKTKQVSLESVWCPYIKINLKTTS